MEKIDQILDSLYDRVIEPIEAKEQLLLLFGVIKSLPDSDEIRMKATIYNGITRSMIEVDLVKKEEVISERTFVFCHYELNGERLYRIETKGRTGKSLYKKYSYLDSKGNQTSCTGSEGATGHGWGGSVIGFMTLKQIEESNLNIK